MLEIVGAESQDSNSDFDILEKNDDEVQIEEQRIDQKNECIDKEIDLCEDDMLKQICHQILDHIEFEQVPNAERDALCRIIMSRGLMDLKEGRITSAF